MHEYDPLGPRTRCLYFPIPTGKGIRGAEQNKRPSWCTLPWHEFAQELIQHKTYPEKGQAPAWSPGEIAAGMTRRSANVIQVHDLVLDLDYGTQQEQLEIFRAVLQKGLTAVLYSTYRHTNELPRTRIVIPLSQPVPSHLWERFYVLASRALAPGSQLDRSTIDPSRLWYSPSRPSNDAPTVAYYHPHGRALDPTEWLAEAAKPYLAGRAEIDPFREARADDLKALLASWRKRGHVHAGTLAALIRHEPYAIEGHRDTTTFQLTRDIVRDAPQLTNESLAQLFLPSLHLMGAPDTYESKLLDMLERARVAIAEERPPEHQQIVALAAEPPREQPLLVHVDDSSALYVLSHGTYVGPIGLTDRQATITTHLAPAVAQGLCTLRTDKGALIPVDELVLRFGRTVDAVEYEIGAPAPRFETDSGRTVLVLPTAYRDGHAQHSPNVEAFLRYLTRSEREYQDLLTWLVVAKSKPLDGLPALALVGPKGLGKGLLASCISTLWWKGGPIPASEAMSAHAQGLLQCPLVFADEQMPVDARTGRMASAQFREAIGAKSFRVNPKYKAPVTVRGCQRWIIAVNEIDKLEFREDLGADAIAAVCERIYLLDLRDRGLAPIPRELALTIISEFFGHVLHLVQTHQLPSSAHRLWIAPERPTLERYMRTEGPPQRGLLLYWLSSFLRSPQHLASSLPRARPDSVLAPPEALAVSLRDVLDSWTLVHPSERRPHPTALARHLGVLADQTRTTQQGLIPLDHALIVEWAQRHHVAQATDLTGEMPQNSPVNGRQSGNVIPIFRSA